MVVSSLPTPQVVVDLPRVRRNIDRMAALAARHGKRLRPHSKTHKSPRLAGWQIEAGAVGICCAKPGEAEVFAQQCVDDIRLPYPVHPSNADRIVALLGRCRISIIVDHLRIAEEWSTAMMRAGSDLDVLVKVDVGLHRCGIAPDLPAAGAFVERVARLPRLRLRGLLSHAGHGYQAVSDEALAAIAAEERDIMVGLAEEARRRGVQIEEISVGATPTARYSAALDGLTELRPGNYVFYDRTQVGLGAATLDDCALTVLARVVSKPAGDRVILDCGSKTLSNDVARGFVDMPGHGLILPEGSRNEPIEGLLVERLSEEHAVVRATAGRTGLEPGDLVRVLPNHACVVTNLVDELVLAEGDEVADMLPVAARGRIR
jgi:D-serine deaminase-like pyridoxal phosphate-dependent protein